MISLKKKGKTLHGAAKEIARRVTKVCDEEASTGTVKFRFNQKCKRVCNYTGISGRTLCKIRKECKEAGDSKLFMPGKHRPHALSSIAHIDCFGIHMIRNIVKDFYLLQKGELTCCKLLEALREKVEFPWCTTILRSLLKHIGYRWKKCSKRTQVLVEHPNSIMRRFRYLNSLRKFREENWNIVYIGETWVDSSFMCKKCWVNTDNMGTRTNVNLSSSRLNILHATGAAGFIKEALLIFKVGQPAKDYDGHMSCDTFEKWLTEVVLPNIPEKSLIILDSSPYNSVELNRVPTEYATKSVMREWLKNNNIPFCPEMYKVELFDLLKKYKNNEKIYYIDEVLKVKGYMILRLPPYTFELNPAEFVWDKVENKIREKNLSADRLTVHDLETAIIEGIASITTSDWNHFYSNVIKIENDYWDTDRAMETKMEKYTVNLLDSDSSDSVTDSGSELV